MNKDEIKNNLSENELQNEENSQETIKSLDDIFSVLRRYEVNNDESDNSDDTDDATPEEENVNEEPSLETNDDITAEPEEAKTEETAEEPALSSSMTLEEQSILLEAMRSAEDKNEPADADAEENTDPAEDTSDEIKEEEAPAVREEYLQETQPAEEHTAEEPAEEKTEEQSALDEIFDSLSETPINSFETFEAEDTKASEPIEASFEAPRETEDLLAEKFKSTESEKKEDFVPMDHYNPNAVKTESDEIFSEIFTEEKKAKKQKENDRKKWQKSPKTKTPILEEIYDWLEVVVLSAAFVIVIFTFFMRIAIVDGSSMENTLHDKEMLIISNFMYEPENNDIIVFNSPNYPAPIVKRVIATENQTVDIDFETWTVTVDGVEIKEDYIKRVAGAMNRADMQFPLTVPEGCVFVMGDNRNDSLDSRTARIGFVDERYIIGEVKIRLTPFDKFGKVN